MNSSAAPFIALGVVLAATLWLCFQIHAGMVRSDVADDCRANGYFKARAELFTCSREPL